MAPESGTPFLFSSRQIVTDTTRPLCPFIPERIRKVRRAFVDARKSDTRRAHTARADRRDSNRIYILCNNFIISVSRSTHGGSAGANVQQECLFTASNGDLKGAPVNV